MRAELRGNVNLRPVQALDCFADNLFRTVIAVVGCCVDQIDAALDHRADCRNRFLFAHRAVPAQAVQPPGADGQLTDVDVGVFKMSHAHRFIILS